MPESKNVIAVDFGEKTPQDDDANVKKVYQIKITLESLKPPLWRRLLVPEGISFLQLHGIIQAAFGWENAHLFSFSFRSAYVTLHIDDELDFFEEEDDLDSEATVIDELLEMEKKCVYEYDFGDGWRHKIILEKILPAQPGGVYPICLAGRRRCPPEDVGGVRGYLNFLETISDPDNPKRAKMLEWATGSPDGKFDSEEFSCAQANERLSVCEPDAEMGQAAKNGKQALSAVPIKSDKCEEPSIKQWKNLFTLAQRLKELQPWETLENKDVFAIELPGNSEPAFVLIRKNSGAFLAVAVYPGYESLLKALRADSAGPDYLPYLAGEQNCLMVRFGNRDDVTPVDREIYRQLELKFRGRNQWIFFRSFSPGYSGWYLERDEAALLETVLPQFLAAYEELSAGALRVHFETGELIWRAYRPGKADWYNEVRHLGNLLFPSSYVVVDSNDEILTLRKVKQVKKHAALAAVYYPVPIAEKGKRPYFLRLLLLFDNDRGTIYQHDLFAPDTPFAYALLDFMEEFIQKYGRPTHLHVDSDLAGFITDFCNKIGIKLKLENIDNQVAKIVKELFPLKP